MERLLADAQKISGVKYDISNLSDVYSAIHVIQEEMGITGTTAKEASETLSGSFASMKAAAKDFMGNLALGENTTQQFNALYSTTKTFLFENLMPMVGNVISGIWDTLVNTEWVSIADEMIVDLAYALGGSAWKIIKNDGSIIDALIAAIEERLPVVLQEGSQMILNLVNGILDSVPKVIDSAGVVLSKFIAFVMQNFPSVMETGVKLIVKLVNGIINSLPKIISSAVTVVAKLVSTIGSNAPKLLESGISLLGKLAAGLIKAVPNLISKIPQIITRIKTAFTSIDWGNVGTNIIKGIAKGISNAVGSIISAAKEAANSALNAAKKALGIHSPSTAFEEEVGEQSDEGWALGIKKNASLISSALKKVSKDTLGMVDTEFSLSAWNSGATSNIAASDNKMNLEGILEGVVLEISNQISIDGRTLKELVYKYVIEMIDGQQKAVLKTKGVF